MTTMVTVEASSHDVEVHKVAYPAMRCKGPPPEIVPKGEKRVFYAHQTQDITVKEIRDGTSG